MSPAASSTSLPDPVAGGLPSRRRLLRLGGLLGVSAAALSGCGFRPLYAPGGGSAAVEDASPDVRAILSSTEVALIPERSGQLLRRALQERLGASGASGMSHELRVSLYVANELEGYRRDGTPSRVRSTVTGNWLLRDRATPAVVLAQGSERAFDAYDVPDNQFFAGDAARDAMFQRLIRQLADDIVLRLSISLRGTSAA